MAASTITTYAAMLQTRYTTEKVEDLCFADNPLTGMITKDEDFAGDGTIVPLIYVAPQGMAASNVALAQANSTNIVSKKFTLTAGDYNASVFMGDKVLAASRKNMAAFVDNQTAEIDGLHGQMGDNISLYLYGNGGNSIGRRASVSGEIITLTEPTQAANFSPGMKLRASVADGSSTSDALRAGTAATVESVNRTAGTVTLVAGGVAAITAFANNDFLFRDGDFRGNTGTFVFVGVTGFIWPDESPTTLYGMVRTDDPQRLAGSRVPAADLVGLSSEACLKKLGTYMTGRYRGKGAKTWFLHPEDWERLEGELSNKGQRSFKDESTRFGYQAITFVAGGVQAKAYVDRNCPKGIALALRLENWKLHSMGKLISPLNRDGLTILRGASANDYEYRLVSYPSVSCNAPGWSGRVGLPS